MQQSRSEVARLLQQIDQEYTAASLALSGFAEGTARHLFITARMERVQEAGEALIETPGDTEAIPLIVDAMEEAQKTAERLKEAIDRDKAAPSIAVDSHPDAPLAEVS